MKMVVISASEMSVFTRVTLRHVPEDGILLSHGHQNLGSYLVLYNSPVSSTIYRLECIVCNSAI
jgi:hypothetical protein